MFLVDILPCVMVGLSGFRVTSLQFADSVRIAHDFLHGRFIDARFAVRPRGDLLLNAPGHLGGPGCRIRRIEFLSARGRLWPAAASVQSPHCLQAAFPPPVPSAFCVTHIWYAISNSVLAIAAFPINRHSVRGDLSTYGKAWQEPTLNLCPSVADINTDVCQELRPPVTWPR